MRTAVIFHCLELSLIKRPIGFKMDSLHEEQLKNESQQLLLRALILSLVFINFIYLDLYHLLIYPFIVAFIHFIYYLIMRFFPYSYQNLRVTIISVIEVLISTYVMYLANELSAYYPALLMWFIIGYGMRYGTQVGYITYVSVIISWSLLLLTSPYWLKNYSSGYGWLIAYLIIPLYFFRLVDKLQFRVEKLHHDVDESMYKAGHDQLTNLPNRYLFEKTLQEYTMKYKAHGEKFALFFIDLDGFKNINDTHGHEIGDIVLIEASKRMKNINDSTSRLGGDEFVSIVPYKNSAEIVDKAKRVIQEVSKTCPRKDIVLAASIGIARYPDDASTTHTLKKNSDIAMYRAKKMGKNRYFCYSDFKSDDN